MPHIPDDCNLDSYGFHLPEELIAQQPAESRDASRLLHMERATGKLRDETFAGLPRLLKERLAAPCLIVANDSKVVPARLQGRKPSGGRVEFLLLTPLPLLKFQEESGWNTAEDEGLVKSSKRPKPGGQVEFSGNLRLTVLEVLDFGRARVRLEWRGNLAALLDEQGSIPLPPYIRGGQAQGRDAERYQTVYARAPGSVAAPTAGLHFTPELKRQLAADGHGFACVTLHVGYGTFSPVRCQDLRDHRMHSEFVEIPEETARAVAQAKAQGRPVLAVGTTTVRALEGACMAIGRPAAFAGWVDIFITPGFTFQAVDALLTNFHLPGSTLLALVSAFAERKAGAGQGRKQILDAYAHAVAQRYRFFSYGDAMLIT